MLHFLLPFLYLLGGIILLVVLWLGWVFGREILRIQRESREYRQLTDTHDLPARIETWAKEYVATRPQVRLTIGVLQQGRRWVQGFGDGPPQAAGTSDERMVYEIGSVTKVFTGILLARLVAEGIVQLEDPITRFLPADVTVPPELAKITLKHLATHTSGLPRLPDNFDAVVKDEANP